VCLIFHSSLTLRNGLLLHISHVRSKLSSPSFSCTTFQNFRGNSGSTFRSPQKTTMCKLPSTLRHVEPQKKLEINGRIQETCDLRPHNRRIRPHYFLPKRRQHSTILHAVTCHKTVFFLVTAHVKSQISYTVSYSKSFCPIFE